MIDPAAFRTTSRERWETAASGWEARRADLQRAAEPVSHWMVEAIAPQPGHVVLELAAGVGDTGFLAAELVKPGGKVICTDGAEPMLEAARRRAAELGLDNVEFEAMEAEWIDGQTASLDAVLCRWGYMLLADPEAALRETRRVLKPGGRVALAAWDAPGHNPWVTATTAELVAQGLSQPPPPDEPGMFSFAGDGVISELLLSTGFEDVVVDAVDIVYGVASFDEWFDYLFDVSPSLGEALARATPEQRDLVYEGIEARLAEFRGEDGSLALPGRTLVAAASA
ncbi:MAG: class I SAM-dependent methyltransferase [Solirubrobacteraceae bacterium]